KPGDRSRVLDYDGAGLSIEFPTPVAFALIVELHGPTRVPVEKDSQMIAALLPIRPALTDLQRRKSEVQTALNEAPGGFNLIWPEAERAHAATLYDEMSREQKILHEEDLDRYLAGLMNRLALVSPETSYPWTIAVTTGTDAKALNAGGGYIFVNRGCFDQLSNEAQLAFVLSREMAHQMKRHVAINLTRETIAMLVIVAGAAAAGAAAGGSHSKGPFDWAPVQQSFARSEGVATSTAAAGTVAMQPALARFSSEQEQDADRIALQMIYDAGYDPRQALPVIQRTENENDASGADFSIISDQSSPGVRLAAVNQWLGSHDGRQFSNLIVNTRDFTAIRAAYRVNRWD
ncbi:MAG TPA: M48 family metallopeptidase, partial [Candidatus Binataceae bacterium]|nr:M48 family metallopeptidase [Candidatus Binataceae bacterium]